MDQKPDLNIQNIEAARQGKQSGYNYLLGTFWHQIYNFQKKRTHNDYEAEEITIQTFARAFSNLDRYDEQYSFSNWLITISKNLHIDTLRRDKNKVVGRTLNKERLMELIDHNPTPEDALINKQSQDKLLGYVNLLKEPYREVIKLRYFEEYSYKEIATELQDPVNSVKVKLLRARRLLADVIKNKKS